MSAFIIERNKIGTIIVTPAGEAKYLHTELEDQFGNWDNVYPEKDGYYIIHRKVEHEIYRLENLTEKIKRLTHEIQFMYMYPQDVQWKIEKAEKELETAKAEQAKEKQ